MDGMGDGAGGPGAPLVSVLMVARDAEPFIGDAILTARRQSLSRIEILVVDDGSTDGTRAVAEAHAAADPRVRVLDGPRQGLAAVRNASLAAARGRWAAILDSDDMVHPRHLERLVAAADATGAEVVAANMVSFEVGPDGMRRAAPFADAPGWREERDVGLADYVAANGAAGDAVSAGYLKPLFDLGFLRGRALGYDPRLRIAEDYDLVARALAAGGRFRYLPRPTYFYRRHRASTSHRLTVSDLQAMIAAADGALAGPAATPAVAAAVARRTRGLRAALAHARAVDALKERRPAAALAALGWDAGAWGLMRRTVAEGAAKRSPRRPGAPADPRRAVLIGEGDADAIRRAPPRRGTEAAVADGLPPVDRVLIGRGASPDDAAYALSPRAEVVVLDRISPSPSGSSGRSSPRPGPNSAGD